jgi:hypothetical protein
MVTDFHLAGLAQAMSDQMKAKHLAQPRMLAFAAPSYLPTSYSSKGPYAPFAMQSISQMHSLSGVKAMSSYSTLPPPQHIYITVTMLRNPHLAEIVAVVRMHRRLLRI